MGFIPATDLPCTVLNPIPHLDQYLIDLNTNDAFESFNQLADSLLANQPPCSPLSECSFSTNELCSPANSQWLSSSSLSSSSSSSFPSSSNPSSPETSDSTFSPSSSTSFASSSSYPSPQSSPFNPASAESSSRTSSIVNRRKSYPVKGDRRLKNASAAEKYRKRVKGRHCSLMQQMEREQERNSRLKRDLASKLSLYREFVTLLANNTTQLDQDLASLGSKSLSTILSDVCWPSCWLDEEVRLELETRWNTFQQVLQANR